MKKIIPLLVICLAVLCFFSSCGMFETTNVEGTWTVDFTDEVGYNKYEYYTFSLVFSGNEVQIIKKQYEQPGRKNLIATEATERMPYTVEKGGVVTASHKVGLASVTHIEEIFSLNDAKDRLVWKIGYSGVRHTLSKESSDTSFITPSRTYEQYKYTGGISYYDPDKGSGILADRCALTLYSDGKYEIEYVNKGSWERNTDHPNEITLTADNDKVFRTMNLLVIPKWDDIEITDVTTTNTGFDCEKDEEHFDLYSSWYRLFYL